MSTNRAVQLAKKLEIPQNAWLWPRVVEWVSESDEYAGMMLEEYGPNEAQKDREGFQLLYILNHLCPSLYHFHRAPDPRAFMGDIEGLNIAQRKHFLENTQVGLVNKDGMLLQEGVEYTKESFDAFCDTAQSIIEGGQRDVQ